MHHRRWQKYGDPMLSKLYRSEEPVVRFMTKVDKSGPTPAHRSDLGPCWLWIGTKSRDGYGAFRFNGRMVKAYRWIYELQVGTIPDGYELDHLCCSPGCVNPLHLEPVTRAENARRRSEQWRNTRTHCPKGHPWATNETTLRSGSRRCRACFNNRRRDARARKALGGAAT